MSRLPEFDAHFAQMNADAAARKEVLRYVGVVDPTGQCAAQLRRCAPVSVLPLFSVKFQSLWWLWETGEGVSCYCEHVAYPSGTYALQRIRVGWLDLCVQVSVPTPVL